MTSFVGFPKIARYSRECIVTEKIDGTNAQIYIPELYSEDANALSGFASFYVGSRTRWITPEGDNHGFARWAYEHAEELSQLGPGHHFGEWWGSGIQRGYGLPKGEKRFSLFNTLRWGVDRDVVKWPIPAPPCCHVVPVLWRGPFADLDISLVLTQLAINGSAAAPFMNPEGIVIFHVAAGIAFKKTLEKDEQPKGARDDG